MAKECDKNDGKPTRSSIKAQRLFRISLLMRLSARALYKAGLMEKQTFIDYFDEANWLVAEAKKLLK